PRLLQGTGGEVSSESGAGLQRSSGRAGTVPSSLQARLPRQRQPIHAVRMAGRGKKRQVIGAGVEAPTYATGRRGVKRRSPTSQPGGRQRGAGSGFSSAPRRYSSVRLRPSRRLKRGSQPSFVRAVVMSGWRIFGSSAGSFSKTTVLGLPVSSMISRAKSRIVISSG